MILSQSIKTRQTIIIVNKILKISNGIEPFATLFWALVKSTSQQLTLHAGPDHSTAAHKACPYMVTVGSILYEDAPAIPPVCVCI